jgi:hypothetical protein
VKSEIDSTKVFRLLREPDRDVRFFRLADVSADLRRKRAEERVRIGQDERVHDPMCSLDADTVAERRADLERGSAGVIGGGNGERS